VRLNLRIATLPRAPDFPREDDALGRALLERLFARLARGPVAPGLIVLESERALAIDVRPALAALRHPALVHRFVSSLAGMPGVEAIAAVGPMRRGARGPSEQGQPVGGAFVEWADGRWWGGWRPLDDTGRPMPTDSDDMLRAVDGHSRPGGLGGWFSRARFEGLAARLEPMAPAPEELVN
jgi:hypothetical protein